MDDRSAVWHSIFNSVADQVVQYTFQVWLYGTDSFYLYKVTGYDSIGIGDLPFQGYSDLRDFGDKVNNGNQRFAVFPEREDGIQIFYYTVEFFCGTNKFGIDLIFFRCAFKHLDEVS